MYDDLSMEKEINDFEDSLRNSNDSLDDFLEDTSSDTYRILQNNRGGVMFTYDVNSSIFNYIKNIYLEFEVNGSFSDLSINEKINLLNLFIRFENLGISSRLITLLIQQMCSGKYIKEYSNRVQIPIYSFEYINERGLNITDTYLNVCILYSPNLISDKIKKINLLVEGKKYNKCVNTINNIMVLISHNYYTMLNGGCNIVKDNTHYTHKTASRYGAILIGEKKYSETDLDFEVYPELTSISIELFNINNKISICNTYTSENFMSIEVFGIPIYILCFVKELDTLEKFSEYMKTPYCINNNLPPQLNYKINIQSDESLDKFHFNLITLYMTNITLDKE